ncbi:MAG: T9SS type A sorting domain-containing protein, partial [Sphingobacteriales bacterium]
HQWFGDNVTCATWKDIWLNEGFASYAEYLYVDHFVGAFQARGYMADVHDDVLSDPSGALYVDDTSNENRIFDSRLSYNKGSAVVHMLRYELNDDSLFFQMLQDYQDAFRDSTATTEEFRTFAEQASGQSLDTFFQQWVYKEGYPYYSARWNQVDSIVYVELTQVASLPSSQTLFRTPLDLELESATGDTVVRVYNNQNVQTFSFVWHKTMQDLSIDPDNWILNITGPILKDVTLDTDDVHNPLPFILPNPAVSSWQVLGLREETTLSLFDLNGRLVWSGTASGIVSIPASQLTAGMYILKLNSKNTSASVKLIKQ